MSDVAVLPHAKGMFRKIRFEFKDKVTGILNFRNYVGKSFLDIETCHGRESIPIEVRSKKINYHEHYPAMLADLSEEISSSIRTHPHSRHSSHQLKMIRYYIFSEQKTFQLQLST